MRLLNKLKTFTIFIRLVRDPNRTDLIFKGVDIVSGDPNQEPVEAIESAVLEHKEFRKMYEQNYVADTPVVQELRNYPEGSFSYAVFKHMDSNNLNSDLFPKYEAQRPIRYLTTRIYQDHDLWHALLGCGVAVEDELAIQAFGIAQFQSPVALLIVAGGLLHLLGKSPKRAIDAFKKINEFYALGRRVPFLLSVRLHDLFLTPLVEVRRMCGVAP